VGLVVKNTVNTIETDNSSKISKQASMPVSISPLPKINQIIPYLIATFFVVITGLFTLLLTIVLDNRDGHERTAAFRAAEPILVSARIAFGQDRKINIRTYDLQTTRPTVNTGKSIIAEPLATKSRINPASDFQPASLTELQPTGDYERPAGLQKLIAHNVSVTDDNPSPPILDTGFAIAPMDNDQTAPFSTDAAGQYQEISSFIPYLTDLPITSEEASSAPEHIVAAHSNKIKFVRHSISRQTHNREQLETIVVQNLQLMKDQIRELEEHVRPEVEVPRTATAYERIHGKRRASFERITHRRLDILRRARQ
jgi:hypothetical protein